MKQTTLMFALVLVGIVGSVVLLLINAPKQASLVGRWHEVGGTEQMIFTDSGDMQVAELGGTPAPGSYTMTDSEHLRVEFALGSPRLVWFSPQTGDMMWTNHKAGRVFRYTNEPGSFLKIRASKIMGF